MSVTSNSLNNEATIFDVDNIRLDGNTISSTNTNGNINLDPDGTGDFNVTSGDVNIQGGSATIDPGAATDAFLQFDESTTAKWRLGNDATDDSYRISQGSALGTNDVFTSSTVGEINLPLQPRFVAVLNGDVNNVTGNGTNYQVAFNAESVDVGGGFDTGTGIYTAPASGFYHFYAALQMNNMTSVTQLNMQMPSTSGSRRRVFIENTAIGSDYSITMELDTVLTATDTVSVNIVAVGEGADTVGLRGGGTPVTTFFWGIMQA